MNGGNSHKEDILWGPDIQRVHKVREHFKLFIAQELQIIQNHIHVILKRNSESLFLPHKLSMSEF
jgi:hypothetical protein